MSAPVAPKDSTFPQVMGAAVLVGGAIALVDRFDRKAAGIFALTLILGVMLSRDITGKTTELIDAVTGTKPGTSRPTGLH